MVVNSSNLIEFGQHVIISMINGQKKIVQLDPESMLNIPRLGKFSASSLVGKPFGLTYEIMSDGNNLRILSVEELNSEHAPMNVECEENNREINDDTHNQELTQDEIIQLRDNSLSGEVSAEEVIRFIRDKNKSFEKKTEFSKMKYLKRKKEKFQRVFKAIKPSTRELSELYLEKNSGKILHLRFDMLSYMLNIGNVCSGGRILVVDEVAGLLMAAVMQRTGGLGTIMGINRCSVKNSWDTLKILDIDYESKENCYSLSWSQLEPPAVTETQTNEGELVERRCDLARKILNEGKFDVLLVASMYNPMEILDRLIRFVAPSRQVVFYNQHLHLLNEAFIEMRKSRGFIDVQIIENWLRKYQIYPQRTHPENNMNGAGGYILSATTVVNDSKDVEEHKCKKVKTDKE